MNYYNHHIGDYAKDTAHLTMLEDAAYRRMLDLYYSSERALPLNRDGLYRLVRARSKDERKAVDTILEEFFHLGETGWHQTRCDDEIAKMKEKADAARNNGRKGGRPKTQRGTETEPSDNPAGFQPETQGKAPNSQEPIASSSARRASRLQIEELPEEWKSFCLAERPDLRPEATFSRFRDFWIGKPGKDGTKADWLATWRNWVRNERGTAPSEAPRIKVDC